MLSRRHYKLLEALRAGFPGAHPQGHVVAAVSGGSDSIALLALLAAARERDDFALTAVYVDHATRIAAAFEAALVCATATRMGASFEYAACTPVAHASEENLRDARYAALASVAARVGADWIATGHTRNDQIETILFRFLRGSGRAGLAGIPSKRARTAARADLAGISSKRARTATRSHLAHVAGERVRIIRPLLALRREELRAFLRAQGLGWTEDASNRDPRHARNRLRHAVIPTIERELGRGRLDHLPDVARTWALEDEFLESEAQRYAAFAIRDRAGGAELDLVAIDAAPPALRTRILRRWLGRAGFNGEPGLRILEAIDRMTASRAGTAELAVAGATVVRKYSTLHLAGPSRPIPFSFAVSADAAADYADPAGAWSVTVDPSPHAAPPADAVERFQVVEFLKKAVTSSLELRSRRADDTIRVGLHGATKVHDIMVEMRVPRRVRDSWPVLATGEKVIWVPGLAVAADMESASKSLETERVRLAWRRLQA